MKYYQTTQSLFSENVFELRTDENDLIGLIEKLSETHYKATNYLKLTTSTHNIQDAKSFILSSFNDKPACQTRIARNQIQIKF